jgi:chemotaxis protein methyltransferase CheR
MELTPRAQRVLPPMFEAVTGQQISEERLWRVGTMLGPICKARGIASLDELTARLHGDQVLVGAVIDALLNNETSFFRDASAFRVIGSELLPRLAEARAKEKRLRIWSAACSTGQEVWSLAMLFAENAARWEGWTIDILGTDLSRSAIEKARDGLYTQFEVQRGLPIRQLMTFFDQVLDEGWRVRTPIPGIRVSFTRHNLIGPAPVGGPYDLILCRNALLYFSAERRRDVLDRLRKAIAPDGALMLGAGETPTGICECFEVDPNMLTIYRPVTCKSLAA